MSKIPTSEIVGVTGILLTCSYKDKEFFRVGYYVNNFYEEEEFIMNPPPVPLIEKLTRHILVERPRVTKFNINWDDGFAFTDENGNPNIKTGTGENILAHGTQFKDRNDMMSSANLAQAQQNFYGQ
mgnify:CR=1 FL=1